MPILEGYHAITVLLIWDTSLFSDIVDKLNFEFKSHLVYRKFKLMSSYICMRIAFSCKKDTTVWKENGKKCL